MKDNGILLLTVFVALVAGLFGFGLGDGMLRFGSVLQAFEGPARIQWEVLLTGVAAIGGGWMAYRGATEPHRRAQAQILTSYLIKLEEEMFTPFNGLRSGLPIIKERLWSMSAEELDYEFRDSVQRIIQYLPEPPEEIVDPEMRNKFNNLQFTAFNAGGLGVLGGLPMQPMNLYELSKDISGFVELIERRIAANRSLFG